MILEIFDWYLPYSILGYYSIIFVTYLFSRLFKNFRIHDNLVYLHNIFLSLQSLFLAVLSIKFYIDIANMSNLKYYDVLNVLTSKERFNHELFDFAKLCFLISKLYEMVDTMILVINRKIIITLHHWHHASIFIAFYTGMYTGSMMFVGFLNSVIHIIMYLYYANVPGIRKIAKYLTRFQMFHLFGGAVLNLYTLIYPIHDLCFKYSIINFSVCMSYFILFAIFYKNKYKKNKNK